MTDGGRQVDVVIAGAGPAGAMAAFTLARARHTVLLIDAGRDAQYTIGESLPPEASPWLRRMGLAESHLAALHRPSYGTVAFWGGPAPRHTDYIASPHGHGWHLDRRAFDMSLREAACLAGAEMLIGTRVRSVLRTPAGGWQLDLAGAVTGRASSRWLIDCTGRASWLARQLGARRNHDDRLVASYAMFATSVLDRDGLTTIEATSEGWWYSARLPRDRRVVVYLTDRDLPTARGAQTTEGFLALLRATQHIASPIVDRGTMIAAPRRAPANSSWLEPVSGSNWLAAGDAAVAFDPLSSFGITVALRTAAHAAECVARSLEGDPDAHIQYASVVAELYARYDRERAWNYRYERRWQESLFWRRHGTSVEALHRRSA